MTPARFRIVKHLTATALAVTVVGVFVLGLDGMIGAMQKLTRLFASAPPPAAVPAAETPAAPGVVRAFVVPAADSAPDKPTRDGRD